MLSNHRPAPTHPWSFPIWQCLADTYYYHDDKVPSSPACWAVTAYIILRPCWALCSWYWLQLRVRLSSVWRCFEGVCTWSPSAQNTAKITYRRWAEGWQSKWLVVGLFLCLVSHYECLLVCQMCWLNKKGRHNRAVLDLLPSMFLFHIRRKCNAMRFWAFVIFHISQFFVKIYCVLTIFVSHCFMVELN